MIGDLSKLFDRNFAVGYFLPAAIFITVSSLILNSFFPALKLDSLVPADLLLGTTLVSLLAWIGGIVLNAVNRDLYRLLEGYGKYNPVRLLFFLERWRHKRLAGELLSLNVQRDALTRANQEIPETLEDKLTELTTQWVEEFPDRKKYLLPTAFGNVLRAFEVYPRMMYQIESVTAWERLLAVIPAEYAGMVHSAKAQVDFWVNVALVTVLLETEYVSFVFILGVRLNGWLIVLFIALGTIALFRATSSAKEWGAFVKSAFDMFLPKMREALGISKPINRAAEQAQWRNFSQAISYHSPQYMPELDTDTPETEPAPQRSLMDIFLGWLGLQKK